MQVPLQLRTHNITLNAEQEERIREKALGLERYYKRITSCRVTIDVPHNHKQTGKHYEVRIDMTVPGSEIVVRREPNTDFNAAIRDTFNAAARQLEDFARKQRQDVKIHEAPPQGIVTRLFKNEGYGFLEDGIGREVYFHENSVLNGGFNHIEVGSEVTFAEEMGEKGPQASTVRLNSK